MYVESGIKHHNPNPTFQYITYQLRIWFVCMWINFWL